MSKQDITQQLIQTVDELSESEALQGICHEHRDGDPLPSAKELEEIIELSRSILFPGFYGRSSVNFETIKYQIGVNVEHLHKLLCRQIMAGLCFNEDCHCPNAADTRRCMQEEADKIAGRVIEKFPTLRNPSGSATSRLSDCFRSPRSRRCTARRKERAHKGIPYRCICEILLCCGIGHNLLWSVCAKGLPRSYMVDLVQLHLPSS